MTTDMEYQPSATTPDNLFGLSAEALEELHADLLYLVRTGDLKDLEDFLDSLVKVCSENYKGLERLIVTRPTEYGGQTALHYAAANNHIQVQRRLLLNLLPSAVNVQNDDGATAVHWAALNGHLEMCKVLLDAGADPKLKNNAGKSASTLAEQQNHMDVNNFLLQSFNPDDDDELDKVMDASGVTASSST